MGSGKSGHHKKKRARYQKDDGAQKEQFIENSGAGKRLEIVLKCETAGSIEAIIAAIHSLTLPEVEIEIISSGVGDVNNSDIFMAETGSRLILGFNAGIIPHIDRTAAEHNVEIRLYEVIYRLVEDVEAIAKSLAPPVAVEEIIGSARVIALFKSSRKGIILGCEVLAGKLMLGQPFRILSAMGPVYTGTIASLHIEKDVVREAGKGQKVGLKIRDFNRVKIGDLVESFHAGSGEYLKPWEPQGKIYYP